MTLKECIEKAPDGKWRRKGWKVNECIRSSRTYFSHRIGKRLYQWTPTPDDLTAEDWEVVE
jgi:hypothetical protein